MFNINTDRLIEILVSIRLQTMTLVLFLKSILEPIKNLMSKINVFRNSTTDKLSYCGQVCSLERLLNDRFDLVNRDIYITDALSVKPLIIYSYQDVEKLITVTNTANFESHPIIAPRSSGIGDNLDKFVIHVPDSNEARSRENELRACVNLYKFSGKGFFIKYY